MKQINPMSKKGFTLIELLVVIAIIGLLSTLAVVALNNAREKSRDAKRIADVKQMQTALELYYNDNNGYPSTTDWSTGSIAASGVTYMAVLPTAPTPYDGTCTSANGTYSYTPVGSSPYTSYTLGYCLGAATGGVAAGAHNANPGGLE